VTADTLDFGACLSRCVLMGPLREHPFELKGYLLRTNIIPHSVSKTALALECAWRFHRTQVSCAPVRSQLLHCLATQVAATKRNSA
jgi:hypothetical protein